MWGGLGGMRVHLWNLQVPMAITRLLNGINLLLTISLYSGCQSKKQDGPCLYNQTFFFFLLRSSNKLARSCRGLLLLRVEIIIA
ncbi:hypothetical protein BC940DRAFT_305736 [Gongronella butleri]|nr:hypothetical protein BC940DRAFT_305736 [Gongronella butleri]